MSTKMDRRDMMKTVGAGAMAFAAGGALNAAGAAEGMMAEGKPAKYELPPLPYDYDALEPVLSEEILKLHHDKHHQGYVNGLNSTLEALAEARKSGDMGDIKSLSRNLAFHGSGHVLHSLYWVSMTPGGSEGPKGDLAAMMKRDFGSVDACLDQFAAATKAVEASGWGVLAHEPMGNRLLVLQAEKHQNLTMWGVQPILVCDVWEHAYYLQYENKRGDYVDGFMKIVDWPGVAKRCAANMKMMKMM